MLWNIKYRKKLQRRSLSAHRVSNKIIIFGGTYRRNLLNDRWRCDTAIRTHRYLTHREHYQEATVVIKKITNCRLDAVSAL